MYHSFHILRVRTGKDFEVAEKLIDDGFNAVCVTSSKTVKHRRTKKLLQKVSPLLRGYLFVHVPMNRWSELRRYSDLMAPVRQMTGEKLPAEVSQEDVALLQELSETIRPDKEIPDVLFEKGQEVEFDFFTKKLRGWVKSISEDAKITVSANLDGKRLGVTRDAVEFKTVA